MGLACSPLPGGTAMREILDGIIDFWVEFEELLAKAYGVGDPSG